jgi:hypothetical protein
MCMVKFRELLPKLYPDLLGGKDLTKESQQIDRNFQKLAEIEIDRSAATQLITALPSSLAFDRRNYHPTVLDDKILNN